MNAATKQMQVNARNVVGLQVGIAAVVAVVFGFVEGGWQSLSAIFGGLISVCSSLLLRRGVEKASEIVKDDPRRGMATLYVGAFQRFVMVAALFALGLALLELDPLAAVVGFGCAQLAYAIVMRKTAHPTAR